MNQAQALHQVQSLDHQISHIKTRLAAIDQLLGENTRLQSAEQTLAQAEQEVAPWRIKVTDLELEIGSIVDKADTVEQRLYSGKITNPKELQDMQEEIGSLRRRRTALDEELLEAMIRVESGQAVLDSAQAALTTTRVEWRSNQADLENERTTLQATLTALRGERSSVTESVEPQNLELYKRLFKSKNGQAVSVLIDTSCGACGVSQTTSAVQHIRQGRELVFCSNCGRVLTVL